VWTIQAPARRAAVGDPMSVVVFDQDGTPHASYMIWDHIPEATGSWWSFVADSVAQIASVAGGQNTLGLFIKRATAPAEPRFRASHADLVRAARARAALLQQKRNLRRLSRDLPWRPGYPQRPRRRYIPL